MPSRVEDYEVLHTIGTGSYGRCQKIRRKSDGKVGAGGSLSPPCGGFASQGRRLEGPAGCAWGWPEVSAFPLDLRMTACGSFDIDTCFHFPPFSRPSFSPLTSLVRVSRWWQLAHS
jgi:hypothetical protein